MRIRIDYENCIKCNKCVEICPSNVFEMQETPVMVNEDACTLCGVCADQCPKQAIILGIETRIRSHQEGIEGKNELVNACNSIVESLGLRKKPVAVKLIATDPEDPKGIRPVEFPLRHCVSINMAANDAILFLPSINHACSAAKAALGMTELPEKVRNGKVPFMHGLAGSQEAAARIMAEIPRLEVGTIQGTVVAPLDKIPANPDVVILVVNPKQAMWIANSYLFEEGCPRITASFAGMQASCGDVTVIPYKSKKVNFSVGCYGCRSAGKLADEEMHVGMPIEQLFKVTENLRLLGKAMKNMERGK